MVFIQLISVYIYTSCISFHVSDFCIQDISESPTIMIRLVQLLLFQLLQFETQSIQEWTK